jgi:hypothetical protein
VKIKAVADAAVEISLIIIACEPEATFTFLEESTLLLRCHALCLSALISEFSGAMEIDNDVGKNMKENNKMKMPNFNFKLIIFPFMGNTLDNIL